ncbi:hypothetical protein P3626_23570 [Vibrio parahaemolyticus]|uniref:Uncharacterized protein n=1 Tax=Vibrio parahaemolyticus TaxID=670 RepID=A0A7Y0XDT3_VIBPH|nr:MULTISPECIES: hypothetical protein [Vibrio]MDW1972781.1 hypothetical protein [Vibrio sp. 945]EGQ8020031.1 hypothetical protein [Vibrio alginolyticus]EHH2535324.1 hypothetical protein [Vibrio parahaemolyticus]EHR6782815.1 hypothetical protein [Vibrio parahaemolyticus]EIA0836445.1 hypothetical protein [Vibrio parahaemolyticus]
MQQRKKAIVLKKEKVLDGDNKTEALKRDEIRRSAALTERATMNDSKIRNKVTFIEME